VRPENNNFILYNAIDEYSIFTANQKKLLRTLIDIAVEDEVVASIADLAKLTQTMRATVKTALDLFEEIGVIEISKITGVRFSACTIKREKLEEIIRHYQKKKDL
jgi:DNA-binding transcriptional regulator YhcF (GntR family)